MKLGKLKMPEKKKLSLADLENEDQGTLEAHEKNESPDEEASEAPEMEAKEEEMGLEQDPSKELEMISDDDLLAELKKRGLMGKLDEEPGQEQAAEEEEQI